LHSRLRKLRIRGEWFRPGYFNLKEILNSYSRKKLKVKAADATGNPFELKCKQDG